MRAGLPIALVLVLGAAEVAADVRDPFESVNRKIHVFNEKVDQYSLEPIARAWEWVVPDFVERRLENFFDNLRTPIILGNDILQLKPRAAGEDVVRFVANTTFGLGGLFDAATVGKVPKHDEDFGQTLGYYGVPPGPFLMLPVLGPSNVRDLAGFGVDSVATVYGFLHKNGGGLGQPGGNPNQVVAFSVVGLFFLVMGLSAMAGAISYHTTWTDGEVTSAGWLWDWAPLLPGGLKAALGGMVFYWSTALAGLWDRIQRGTSPQGGA